MGEREREILSVSLAVREGGHPCTGGDACGGRRYLQFWTPRVPNTHTV